MPQCLQSLPGLRSTTAAACESKGRFSACLVMTLCERCGSIRIVRVRLEPADRLVAVFTGRRPFLCRRCGWRGRRNWSDKDLKNLLDYSAGGAETDPALAALDQPHERRKRGNSVETERASTNEHAAESFELDSTTLASGESSRFAVPRNEKHAGRSATRKRRPQRSRRKQTGRRGMLAAIAGSALLMFLAVILSLTGSCRGSSDGI